MYMYAVPSRKAGLSLRVQTWFLTHFARERVLISIGCQSFSDLLSRLAAIAKGHRNLVRLITHLLSSFAIRSFAARIDIISISSTGTFLDGNFSKCVIMALFNLRQSGDRYRKSWLSAKINSARGGWYLHGQ